MDRNLILWLQHKMAAVVSGTSKQLALSKEKKYTYYHLKFTNHLHTEMSKTSTSCQKSYVCSLLKSLHTEVAKFVPDLATHSAEELLFINSASTEFLPKPQLYFQIFVHKQKYGVPDGSHYGNLFLPPKRDLTFDITNILTVFKCLCIRKLQR